MTKIKICGLSRPEDIEEVNACRVDYAGFVFWEPSRRYITAARAKELKAMLLPEIAAVGVFIDERAEIVAKLLNDGVIDMAQLHGSEDEAYIGRLRELADGRIIKAFRIRSAEDAARAEQSSADYILLDSGAGSGEVFDWSFLRNVSRPYFLAGGLDPHNVKKAIETLHPFAADVSSGVETDGKKDKTKIAAFVSAVREGSRL